MALAHFRFYEELNDFLPSAQRKWDLALEFDPPVPVRHLIETFGVPHTEVEVILINGQSVDLDSPVQDGDRVSVYPMFEALDVTPLLRLREHPLRDLRFVVDAHLGKLARYLRMLGFDTLFENDWGDRELASISAEQQRILLTRDRDLLMHRIITHGCYVRSGESLDQLEYVVRRLDLCGAIRPFSRCMICNGLLEAVEEKEIQDRLLDDTREAFNEFWRCCDCEKVYWKGSHYQRMYGLIGNLCAPVRGD
ncbi:Mut7-C RNAse domain-containing protein [Pseudomonadota bacterium]